MDKNKSTFRHVFALPSVSWGTADARARLERRARRGGLGLDCRASALLDPPRQFLVARRDDAHHPLGLQVVRTRCSDQDFLSAGSQLVREQ